MSKELTVGRAVQLSETQKRSPMPPADVGNRQRFVVAGMTEAEKAVIDAAVGLVMAERELQESRGGTKRYRAAYGEWESARIALPEAVDRLLRERESHV